MRPGTAVRMKDLTPLWVGAAVFERSELCRPFQQATKTAKVDQYETKVNGVP